MRITRRDFVGGTMAAALLSGMRPQSQLPTDESLGPHHLFWGDLHNHNAVGYASGSLERSIDLAREHLDFFAFTGHASWHDMPLMPGDRHLKWVRGFEVHSAHWPKTRQLIEEANTDDFVAFLGYEWHSSQFGDYCVILPEDEPDLFLPGHVDTLLDYATTKGALAIPHHLGYQQGWRGANFAHFRPGVSPVVEIFSEHGCCESDRAPYPMLRHSLGGRSTANMVIPQLASGLRFGFVASSDDHRGYPGAYGEGVVGVWARDLTREALWDAIRARRTYAATGDRIALEVSLNGHPMGGDVPATTDREIDVCVEGQDSIQMIELVRNGRVIQRHFPEDELPAPRTLPGQAKFRIQYGWGPWADLDLGRTCEWDMTVTLDGGQFVAAVPCFQAGPFDEDLRDRLQLNSPQSLRLTSFTSRVKAYAEDPTKSIVCAVDASPEAMVTLELTAPVRQTVRARLADLIHDNVVTFTGVFTTESYILSRLIGPAEYTARLRWTDHRPGNPADWYYVRVTQHNGQLAWSSPIWVG